MNYLAIIEKDSDGSFSAFVPDLPGCVSCGDTADEVRTSIQEAVKAHIDSLRLHGDPVPAPTTSVHTVHAV